MKISLDLFKGKPPSKSVKPTGWKRSKGISVALVGGLAIFIAGVVMLLAAAFLYWTATGEVSQERNEKAVLSAESVAKKIGGFLQSQMNAMAVLVADPEIMAEMVRASPQGLRKQVEMLHSRFPESFQIRLLLPGMKEVDMEAVPPISYSVLETLRLAESGTTPPPVEALLVGTDQQHVNLVRPIRNPENGEVAGHMVASFGLQVLEDLVRSAYTGKGYIELQQPTPSGAPLVLAAVGNPGLKSGAGSSRLPTVTGSRWHLAHWDGARGGHLSATGERNIVIVLTIAMVCLILLLFLLFRWLSKLLDGDHAILINMLDELEASKRKQYPPIRLAACLGVAELIRDIAQTKSITTVSTPSTDGASPVEGKVLDPIVESIEPDGGVFGVQEVNIDPVIFRKYDIRGIVDTSLTPEVVYEIGRAIGSAVVQLDDKAKTPTLIVGRDGRLSGAGLVDALSQGARATGCSVIDIGVVPTPVVYFAANTLDYNSAVMVTGSHNPPEYNGMKIVLGGDTLAEEGIQDLYRRINEGDLLSGSGSHETRDIVPDYIKRILKDVKLDGSMKVVVDCGNGVAGGVIPQLLRELGCEIIELYCEVDGNFPNHHPDPGKPENLVDLVQAVLQNEADIGLAFDGDGDRIGIVASDGAIIWPDRLMMLFAMDVLNRNDGAEIIYDVKCSRHLAKVIKDFGGKPLMWKTGHSLIKGKMKETGALLAGEMSGHIFFKERWYGFDDALYSAARLLEILVSDPRTSASVFAALPDSINTPEINIAMQEGEPAGFMERLLEKTTFEDATIATIDGLRADFSDGWGLVRASNTTPCLVLRFEADTAEALERIKGEFKQAMLAVEPELDLQF